MSKNSLISSSQLAKLTYSDGLFCLTNSPINLWILCKWWILSASAWSFFQRRRNITELTVEFVLQPSVSCQTVLGQKLLWVRRLHERNDAPLRPGTIRQAKNRTLLLFCSREQKLGKSSLVTRHVINRWFGGLANGKHIHPQRVMVKSHSRVLKPLKSWTGN